MVIQPNMTPQAIVSIWTETRKVFEKYRLPVTDNSLYSLVPNDISLQLLLTELNNCIGSTYNTCVEGG
ncbi:hypothetical protein GCM10007199_35950 [Fictibacillus barbaricus]|nr:hypothetical protein GCM10007199_35950 [Fictibacillus barbaricus]